MGPSVQGLLTICSNGSAPLNKMTAMSIFDKNALKSSSPVLRMLWGWILVYSIGASKSTKFVKMMRLVWPLTFLWYGQICVPVAVAILKNVAWHLQICNGCFYQVSELWPMGLLLKFFSKMPQNVWGRGLELGQLIRDDELIACLN